MWKFLWILLIVLIPVDRVGLQMEVEFLYRNQRIKKIKLTFENHLARKCASIEKMYRLMFVLIVNFWGREWGWGQNLNIGMPSKLKKKTLKIVPFSIIQAKKANFVVQIQIYRNKQKTVFKEHLLKTIWSKKAADIYASLSLFRSCDPQR